jgi:hypothetical protein
MSYVGTGCGEYVQETTYKYVGAGAGEFDVLATKRPSMFGIFLGGGVGLVVLVVVIVIFLIPKPTTTTTTSIGDPYKCDLASTPSNPWSIAQSTWCCANKQLGCTTTSTTGTPYNCDAPAPWSPPQTAFCCKTFRKGCVLPAKLCTLWGDPHIIAFDQPNQDKRSASSFYGDGDFWLVKSSTISIQARFEGTKYTEGLAATNQIVVSGSFIGGHKIEVGTRESGIVTVDGRAIFASFPASSPFRGAGGSFTVSYDAQPEVPDVVPEGNEKRVVSIALPHGIRVTVFQWSNYIDVTIKMSPQPGQDGVCGNFNGNQADDTTQAIMSRIGARIHSGQSLLSGSPTVVYTHQMEKMVKVECSSTKLASGRDTCTKFGLAGTLFHSCVFDECFGMVVNARSHAKQYA